MRRLLMLVALFSTLAFGTLFLPCSTLLAATTTDSERQQRDLPVIKKEILDSTKYGEAALDVIIKDSQFVVTITNSKLNKASARQRETEASIIVSSITKAIYSRPEFGSIIGIHVDYIAKDPASGHVDTIDGIDFRKDPSGNFVHHMT